MKQLFLITFLTISNTALASGGVHCEKIGAGLPPVNLSWGAGHVEGSGRISPYRLTLSGREIHIVDKTDPVHLKHVPKGTETAHLAEVGYWNATDKILVRLADSQVMRSVLVLQTVKTKPGVFEGTLDINDLLGIKFKNLAVRCSTE